MATKKKNATKAKTTDHVREIDGKNVTFRVAVDDAPAAPKKKSKATEFHVARAVADANGIKDGDPAASGAVYRVDDPSNATPSETVDAPAAKKTKSKKRAKAATELTLATLSEGYLHALEDTGAGTGTIASYGMELKLAQRELGSETPVATLTEARVREYFNSDAVMKTRTGKPKASPTYLKTQRVLRQALCWAQAEKLIEKAPAPEMSAAK